MKEAKRACEQKKRLLCYCVCENLLFFVMVMLVVRGCGRSSDLHVMYIHLCMKDFTKQKQTYKEFVIVMYEFYILLNGLLFFINIY